MTKYLSVNEIRKGAIYITAMKGARVGKLGGPRIKLALARRVGLMYTPLHW